jgi:hypothetical protein
MHVNCSAVNHGAASGCASIEWTLASSDWHWSIHRYVFKDIAVNAINHSISRVA